MSDQGIQGPRGIQGPIGEQGIQGQNGASGERGARGPAGHKISNFRQRLALALIIIGGIGLSGAIVGVVNLVTTVRHQGAQLTKVVGELKASTRNQLSNRVANVYTWCGLIKQGRDYDRALHNITARQSSLELAAIQKAVNGHSHIIGPKEADFLTLYLASITALEKADPFVLNLRPYTLKDPPCKKLAHKTAQSGKAKARK